MNPLPHDFAQASGLDSRDVGARDQIGAQQLSQGVRVDGVGFDLGRGNRSHPEGVRQLNLLEVVDGCQPVLHHAPVPARFQHRRAWLAQRLEELSHRCGIVGQPDCGSGGARCGR